MTLQLPRCSLQAASQQLSTRWLHSSCDQLQAPLAEAITRGSARCSGSIALQGVKFDLKLPPASTLISQPPADSALGDAAMFHYTWCARCDWCGLRKPLSIASCQLLLMPC